MPRLSSLGYRNRVVLRAWFVFAGAIAIQMALFLWFGPRFEGYATRGTAKLTAQVLSLLGDRAEAREDIVISSFLSIRVILECTALFPMMVFTSAVLAYPCRWGAKLYGLVLGLLALLAINSVRLVSLIYIGHRFPGALETAHLVVWQSLMIFFTVLLWLLWAATLPRRHERAIA